MATAVIQTDTTILVPGPPQGQWTLADWEKLPDDGNRYEIIDGIIYTSTAPSLFHQWIIQQLYRRLGFPAEDQNLAIAFLSPVGVIMPNSEPVQPDFVLVLAAHKAILQDRRIRGVPDLIVEVISPGSVIYDEEIKRTAYATAGVPEYGIIDPAKRTLKVYSLKEPGEFTAFHTFSSDETVTLKCLPTITFTLSDLFAGSPDTTL
jgi:Uma2 family endonuclease